MIKRKLLLPFFLAYFFMLQSCGVAVKWEPELIVDDGGVSTDEAMKVIEYSAKNQDDPVHRASVVIVSNTEFRSDSKTWLGGCFDFNNVDEIKIIKKRGTFRVVLNNAEGEMVYRLVDSRKDFAMDFANAVATMVKSDAKENLGEGCPVSARFLARDELVTNCMFLREEKCNIGLSSSALANIKCKRWHVERGPKVGANSLILKHEEVYFNPKRLRNAVRVNADYYYCSDPLYKQKRKINRSDFDVKNKIKLDSSSSSSFNKNEKTTKSIEGSARIISQQQSLNRLQGLYDKGLISEAIYEKNKIKITSKKSPESLLKRLNFLQQLFDEGLIGEEAYNAKKELILAEEN